MANKPNGNLTGIKSAMLDRLKSLYDFKQGLDEFASFELLSELCACSGEINREISTRTQAGTAGFPELISERCAQ